MATDPSDSSRQFRIGEFSRRVGVKVELLRAWERRYGILTPQRTAGGLRTYDSVDERRVRRMQEHLRAGMSTAEAADLTRRELGRDALAEEVPREGARGEEAPKAEVPREGALAATTPTTPAQRTPAPGPGSAAAPAEPAEFWQALDRLDDAAANAAFDRLLGAFTTEGVVREAVLPYLRELGHRWQHIGAASIAQEHFASTLLRGRLLGLARGWGGGHGPKALLACFPRDQHDLGLICFGLALHQCGWSITFLGTNTPFETVETTARGLHPDLVVLAAATLPDEEAAAQALAQIGAVAPLALAGGGIRRQLADAVGATLLTEDPFTAARRVSLASAAEAGGAGVAVGAVDAVGAVGAVDAVRGPAGQNLDG